jgi:ubiquinol-cytochrome c reductase subunit 7
MHNTMTSKTRVNMLLSETCKTLGSQTSGDSQDVEAALMRLPIEVQDARMQRHKRAMDLSMKHTSLPKEMQAKQTPFEFYLWDTLSQVRAEEAERFSLGAGRTKDRPIP